MINPTVAKRIKRALFSSHGVPRYQTAKQKVSAIRSQARKAIPVLKRRIPKLAPGPKVKIR